MTTARFAATALLALALFSGAVAAPDDTRLPVPDAVARAPAVAALRKEIAADLKSKDADVKRKLARTLLDRAADAKSDAVNRYVLLDQVIIKMTRYNNCIDSVPIFLHKIP